MNVLVYGLGRSGRATARLLVKQGHQVSYFDQAPDPGELAELGALGCRPSEDPGHAQVDLCIAAPGVPYHHPDLLTLRQRGIETIGEVEWVYRTVAADIVGVTGTAGKSTVTSWLAAMLQGAGRRAVAGGNIDPALAEVAEEGALLIAELSSFQLERCPTLKPKVAVLLNVGSDHLDRHGSLAAYREAKRALLANLTESDTLVYNLDDPLVRAWAEATKARRLSYSIRHSADASLQTDALTLSGKHLLHTRQLGVVGSHQYSNALAVALVGRALHLTTSQIRAGLEDFTGVPGRYSLAGEVGGVRFIEDSIATRTLAVKAALEATPAPIVWIAGGVDKGAELDDLLPLVEQRVVHFVGVGSSGPALADKLRGITSVTICHQDDGEAALYCACSIALEKLTDHAGGSVLLAPLAASFDQFSDYRERGAAFRRVVKNVEAAQGVAWTRC